MDYSDVEFQEALESLIGHRIEDPCGNAVMRILLASDYCPGGTPRVDELLAASEDVRASISHTRGNPLEELLVGCLEAMVATSLKEAVNGARLSIDDAKAYPVVQRRLVALQALRGDRSRSK